MNVLLISECDKKALTESRRILDQFAERRGERTWQTPITKDGLETLHRLLRKTARKNTAVACHWIRGLDHTELLWVVGDRDRFNALGAVPTNTTQRNVLRRKDENDWHTGDLIRLLVDLAGLLHDLGKAIQVFQLRLKGLTRDRNLIRHEWVSLRMFEAFVGDHDDGAWLARLADPSDEDNERWSKDLRRDGLEGHFQSPFKRLAKAPLAQAIGWLVVTHHRLPDDPDRKPLTVAWLEKILFEVQPAWNESHFKTGASRDFEPYWKFADTLPVKTAAWRQRASRIAKRLLEVQQRDPVLDPLSNPFVMHLSRLCLMLADHHYSRLEKSSPERIKVKPGNALFANTCAKSSELNQPLDEHLLGVAQHGAEVARFLPRFQDELPHLGRVRKLRQRANDPRFHWQNKSAELAAAMRESSLQQGAFIVNLASTGCGKTLANARIMDALADPKKGMRCAFAMGLRTLTLQTGQAFRERLGLDDDALAIRVGGSASRDLFERHAKKAETTGSASSQDLLEEDGVVLFEGMHHEHPLLRRAVADPKVRNLLVAPILVCTIDHLTPATESQRGGRQIAPMLRLLSGDLVLDEPDDFDLGDLPALTRLVHWAGLLGSRVLLSSATLPPALVQGLFEAYRNGRHHFQRNCSARPGSPDVPPTVSCAWVDEFHQEQQGCADASGFMATHLGFARRRCEKLAGQATVPRRLAELVGLPTLPNTLPEMAAVFAPLVLDAAQRLHRDHSSIDPRTGQRVSFGLVRIANIEPLIAVALELFKRGAPEGLQIHLCVYHSRHPLLVRSAIERELDATLRRVEPDAVFDQVEVRKRLDASEKSDHLFIVLGSPVTEVGRDHDYDWAVVEPSSMRSLIQLAGRVRRHRLGGVTTPNILVFKTNLRFFRRRKGEPAYCYPGFESADPRFKLAKYNLEHILRASELAVIDARPRIVARETLTPTIDLVDLEHARLQDVMLTPQSDAGRPNASTWWQQDPRDALLTGLLPSASPFRKKQGLPEVVVALFPDDDGDQVSLHELLEAGVYVERDAWRTPIPDSEVQGARIASWATVDYLTALHELAKECGRPLKNCAEQFGAVSVPFDNDRPGWRYHPVLGFAKAQR